MAHDISFSSVEEATAYLGAVLDRPVVSHDSAVADGAVLTQRAHHFPDGGFTNVYDIAWSRDLVSAGIRVHEQPAHVSHTDRRAVATTSGSFFALADRTPVLPRHTSLNLVVRDGRALSLPVADREAVVCRGGDLSVEHVPAAGLLEVNGTVLPWRGSRRGGAGAGRGGGVDTGAGTGAGAEVYGNGNISIEVDNARNRSRAVRESSKHTPPTGDPDVVDVGFDAAEGGVFRSSAARAGGGLPLFPHDVVIRCPRALVRGTGDTLRVLQVGPWPAGRLPDHAVSAGPSLHHPDLAGHPINADPSLGDNPPFAEVRAARMLLHGGADGRIHVTLFDARPGSADLVGATPEEARAYVAARFGFTWGCFLDGGSTARIWTRQDTAVRDYGNRHYLRWPTGTQTDYVWEPAKGRPMANHLLLMPRYLDIGRGRPGPARTRRAGAGPDTPHGIEQALKARFPVAAPPAARGAGAPPPQQRAGRGAARRG
ncbi:hypothetical protein LG943_15605 [Streptomonospora sp. S1-112]|uniref:Phosphodiester glycosidase domain-containing protein n=1 Tax=Streptomonospora mangrovi TaxID=2883123 RepID=A0A9X3NL39_9ACTN|nr:hypothetical protein [Streptomonospora mangrovi]MDA0565729.1 hypothetical protein [Streptomonospora mangrovi]